MNAAKAILEMLKEYNVNYVFGLPGETTIPLYVEWSNFPEIKHILARDERSASFMADAYARVSFAPGVCEGPSVGSTHLIPGVAEAYKASVPMIVFTTDIPLHLEKRNMLTGLDQTALFKGITKETVTITKAVEIPNIIRRAFRLATTGKPGPVHIRIPMDIFGYEIKNPKIYAQKCFVKYPGHRPIAEIEKIKGAVKLLCSAERPLIICGQGVLLSQAWDEVTELAELLGIPVGTTMTGKGSIAETHPLSIGVIGSRGGTSFSNTFVEEADLIFYIGCNTDSAGTAEWSLPAENANTKIIHLDISEGEVGNVYRTEIELVGDAKATLNEIIKLTRNVIGDKKYEETPRIKSLLEKRKEYDEYIEKLAQSDEKPVHPLRFIKEFSKVVPEDHIIVADAGIGAIYASAFYKVKRGGRSIIFNYSLGALGYAIPATVGCYYAKPNSCIVALTGDGSFGFAAGEFETIRRTEGNIKIFLFNNGCYGWIKASIEFSYGLQYIDFSTNFKEIDYQKIAEGFGLRFFRIESVEDLHEVLHNTFRNKEPAFIEIIAKPENELVPPVPSWVKKAKELGIRYVY
jgi:acetolactate synthase-1/2/3 large subunit